MHDFWPACGYRLMGRDPQNHLSVSDDFLRSLLLQPELAPIADSCADELGLHERLMASPRGEVSPAQVAAIKDADASANYAIWLRFRSRLLAAPTLEASYMALFQGGGVDVPPQFVHHLTQILARHILGNAVRQAAHDGGYLQSGNSRQTGRTHA